MFSISKSLLYIVLMGNVNELMGNISFEDPRVDWNWGPTTEEIVEEVRSSIRYQVEDIRQSIGKFDLHRFVYGEELPLGRWISKTWNLIEFRKCLSHVLKCDTSDWWNMKLCEEVEKLFLDICMRPHQGYQNKYFIRKKYDYEL